MSKSKSRRSASKSNSIKSKSKSTSARSRSRASSYTRFFTKSSFLYYALPINIPKHVGLNTGITMRMGDGIDDTGMLGALPSIYTFYSHGISRSIVNYHTDGAYNTTKKTDLYNSTACDHLFRFVVFPCYSKCPARFTHRVLNETQFSTISHLKGQQISQAVENATRDTDVFILDFINTTFVVFNDTTVPMSQFLNFSSGDFWGGFVFGVSFNGAWTDPAASKYMAVLPTTTNTSALYISMRLSFNRIRFNGTATGLLFEMDDEFPFNSTARPGTFTPVAAFSMFVDDFMLYPVVRNATTSTINLDTTSEACDRYNPFDVDRCQKYKTVHSFIDMHVSFNASRAHFYRMEAIVPLNGDPPYIRTTANYGMDSADDSMDVTEKIGSAVWRLESCMDWFMDPLAPMQSSSPTQSASSTPADIVPTPASSTASSTESATANEVILFSSILFLSLMCACCFLFIAYRRRRRTKKRRGEAPTIIKGE